MLCSPRVEITIPNVTRDLLIFAPSLSLSPAAPLVLARSLENETKTSYKSEEYLLPTPEEKERRYVERQTCQPDLLSVSCLSFHWAYLP